MIFPLISQAKNSGEFYERRPSIKQPRNFTKADILIQNRNGDRVVLKDYRKKNFLIRNSYGRFTLKKEAEAYSRLSGVEGVPRCFGLEKNYVLILEYINGKTLSSFKSGEVPESVFFKLEKILFAMHSRGVVNSDLHRSNVILTPDWDVYIVDFASALFTDKADNPGFFFRGIKNLDLHAFERMRCKYLCLDDPVPKGFFGVCYNVFSKLKRRVKKIKRRVKKKQITLKRRS
jgi:predicted Ser/Thr protein kinase